MSASGEGGDLDVETGDETSMEESELLARRRLGSHRLRLLAERHRGRPEGDIEACQVIHGAAQEQRHDDQDEQDFSMMSGASPKRGSSPPPSGGVRTLAEISLRAASRQPG